MTPPDISHDTRNTLRSEARKSLSCKYPARDSNPDAELSEVAHATDPKRADQRARQRSLVNLLIKSQVKSGMKL